MTWIDYLALLVIGFSVLLSFWRGAVREIFSLAGWVIAYFAAVGFADDVAPLMPRLIAAENLRLLAAYIVVFALCALAVSLLGIVLSALLKAIGLGAFDRLLGAGVGFLRGLLFTLMLVLAAGLTSLPSKPAWRNSMFSPIFEAAGTAVKPLLPEALARNIRYE